MPRHAFRLPSLHRLNTKDLAAPPTAISSSTNNNNTTSHHHHTLSASSTSSSGYQPLTTPPSTSHANKHHHSDSATLSPSSTTSSSSNCSSSSSYSRIRHLLAVRRKQSRINIEREIADEAVLFGGPDGGFLSIMEPRPGVARVDGGAGGVVMGGIFEVLGGR